MIARLWKDRWGTLRRRVEDLAGRGRERSTARGLPDLPGTGPDNGIDVLVRKLRAESEALSRSSEAAHLHAVELLNRIASHRPGPGLVEPPPAPAGPPEEPLAAVEAIVSTSLNAALAAIRAGAAARGFATAALEVRELGDQVRAAWTDLEPLVHSLEEQAGETAAIAASLRAESDTAPGSPYARAAEVAAEVGRLSRLMARSAEGLSERVAELGSRPDRRREPRVPFELPCRLITARGTFEARTRDLSSAGALIVVAQPLDLSRGHPFSLVIEGIGVVTGVVAGTSPQGLHLGFDIGHAANARARAALRAALAGEAPAPMAERPFA
jgi:hypothetical protein